MNKLLVLLAFLGVFTASQAFASFDKNLAYGAKGASVTEMQEFLTDQGVYSGPITGNFYSLTLKAVKAFQTRENILPKSGYWNLATRTKANEILAEELVESDKEQPTVADKLANPDLLTLEDAANSFTATKNENYTIDPSSIRWTNPVTLLPNPAPITDYCENIFGNQSIVPLGYVAQPGNFCVKFLETLPQTNTSALVTKNASVGLQANMVTDLGRQGSSQKFYTESEPITWSASSSSKVNVLLNLGNPTNSQCVLNDAKVPTGEVMWGGNVTTADHWTDDILKNAANALKGYISYRKSLGINPTMTYEYRVTCTNPDNTSSSARLIFNFVE